MLERRRNEFDITVSDRTESGSTYTTISDEQLCSVVREILEVLPDVGETYIVGVWSTQYFVQRQRIRDAINTVDPVSRAMQRSICIMCRVYSVAAPNSLW